MSSLVGKLRNYDDGWEIYSLSDPDTQQVKYVGVSRDATERLGFHLRFSWKRDTPVRIWVDDLVACDKAPTMKVLQSGIGPSYYKLEKQWVAKLKLEGANLLNVLSGGSGRGPSKPFTEEHKAKLLACTLGHKMSEAQKQKMAEGRRSMSEEMKKQKVANWRETRKANLAAKARKL